MARYGIVIGWLLAYILALGHTRYVQHGNQPNLQGQGSENAFGLSGSHGNRVDRSLKDILPVNLKTIQLPSSRTTQAPTNQIQAASTTPFWPRSANLNLSVEVFGHSFNLLGLDVRTDPFNNFLN